MKAWEFGKIRRNENSKYWANCDKCWIRENMFGLLIFSLTLHFSGNSFPASRNWYRGLMIGHFSLFGYPSHVDARNFWWQQSWFSISMDPWAWCRVLHITSGLLSNSFSVHRSMRQLSLPCFDIIGHMQFLGEIIFCVRSLVGSSQALVSSNVLDGGSRNLQLLFISFL